MVNNIKDSLFVRALLDPCIDLRDTTPSLDHTQGNRNKKALINRVKKLDDQTRLELMSELNHILLLLKEDPKVGLLRERGLCVVLLTDDGTPACERGICDIICQMFKNFCGYSASSETIVDKISEVQAELPLQRSQNSLTISQIKEALQSRIDEMRQEQSAIENGGLAAKIAQFKCLKADLKELHRLIPTTTFDLVETPRFINKTNAINDLISKDDAMCKTLNGFPTKIQAIVSFIALFKAGQCSPLVKELQGKGIPLNVSERNKLLLLGNVTQFSEEQKIFLTQLILSVAARNINNFIEKINKEKRKERQKPIENSKLIKLAADRQSLLCTYELSNLASHEVAALHVENQKASEIKLALERICSESIDVLLNESNEKYDDFKKFVDTHKQLIFYESDKRFKDTHDYLTRIVYVYNILNSDSSTLVKMAESINFNRYLPLSQSDPTQKALYAKLLPFVAQKQAFPLQTDEDRKALAIAYLNYLEFLFKAERNVVSAQIALRQARIDLIQRTPESKLASLNLSVVAPALQVNRAVAAPLQEVQLSTSPKDQLKSLALTLYHVHANNASQAEAICQQLNGETLSGFSESVYQNFYWLMSKNGMIKNDRSGPFSIIESKWGRAVFHAAKVADDVQNAFPEEVNQHRAKAMYLASIGRNVYERNCSHLNIMMPSLFSG